MNVHEYERCAKVMPASRAGPLLLAKRLLAEQWPLVRTLCLLCYLDRSYETTFWTHGSREYEPFVTMGQKLQHQTWMIINCQRLHWKGT